MLGCLARKQTFIILSRGERQSKKFIEESVAPHVRAAGAFAQFTRAEFPKTDIFTQQVEFGNGSRIIALPANPETARSYEGHVVLDEYGFHQDARKIYEAVAPSITRGYTLAIISTPNGQQGQYYDLAKEAGLVDGRPSNTRWSAHKTDIFEAITQGCKDRDGNVLDIADLRADCFDDEMWLQEYCCQFLSTSSQWIPPELFDANVEQLVTEDLCTSVAELDDRGYENLYAGWDIARHKDLSVIWVVEKLGDVTVTRGVIELTKMPTPAQTREAEALLARRADGRRPIVFRMSMDTGSMGLAMYESLLQKFGHGQVEGVSFTLANKENMAVHTKRRMEQHKTRIPDTDAIRNSFRLVKKTATATGQARFDSEHDAKYGHADHWWACCLAEQAAGQPGSGLIEFYRIEAEAIKARRASQTAPQAYPTAGEAWTQQADGQMQETRQRNRAFGAPVINQTPPSRPTKPAVIPRTQKCPNCGNAALSSYIAPGVSGDRIEGCGPCGWEHRTPGQ